jgi:hypothetical protein
MRCSRTSIAQVEQPSLVYERSAIVEIAVVWPDPMPDPGVATWEHVEKTVTASFG